MTALDPAPGEPMAEDIAVQPAPDPKTKQQAIIMWFLGLTLLTFAVGLVAIGVASFFWSAADPQAVNATRENLGQLTIFILGVFAALVAPNAAQAVRGK